MKTIFISFLIGKLIGLILPLIIKALINKKEVERNIHKKRFCHHCMMAYVSDNENDYIYCPVCGKSLQFFNEEPFDEFNKKDGE